MDCCEFREKYSDFADGLLPGQEELRARQHVAGCGACRRFDAAFRTGVDALRGLSPVGVSRGFAERLKQQLQRELAVRVPAVHQWSGAVGALLIVATIGFVGWDLIESHGAGRAKHPAAAAWNGPRVVTGVRATALTLRRDTAALLLDAFHPLHPIMIIADTHSALYEDHLRFDVPAVWGGR